MKKVSFPISGMHCASCAANIQRKLGKVSGVHQAHVNYANEHAMVEFDESHTNEKELSTAVSSLGYKAHLHEHHHHDVIGEERVKVLKQLKLKLIVSGILNALLLVGAMLPFAPDFLRNPFIMWLLATPIQFWAGDEYYKSAWSAFKNRTTNMDTLIALGTSIAYFFSVAVVMVMFMQMRLIS